MFSFQESQKYNHTNTEVKRLRDGEEGTGSTPGCCRPGEGVGGAAAAGAPGGAESPGHWGCGQESPRTLEIRVPFLFSFS